MDCLQSFGSRLGPVSVLSRRISSSVSPPSASSCRVWDGVTDGRGHELVTVILGSSKDGCLRLDGALSTLEQVDDVSVGGDAATTVGASSLGVN